MCWCTILFLKSTQPQLTHTLYIRRTSLLNFIEMAAAENKLTLPAPVEAEGGVASQERMGQTTDHTGEKTSERYRTFNIPDRFENPDVFEGYQNKPQHPMYTTSTMVYGAKKPAVHTMPTSFHCKSQKFSEHLGKCGMYRNQGLNTALDQSKV